MEISKSSKATTEERISKRKYKNTDGKSREDMILNSSQKLRKKSPKHQVNVPRLTQTKERDNKLKTDEVDNVKKAKKRKRPGSEAKAPQSGDPEEQEERSPKRKNRTEFADPRGDSTLNRQSRKALEYAFMQMNKPSKWKFSKARQNWIIRNLWSPEALPETYVQLTLKYLSKVQGGSRTKLVEEAQTFLHPKGPPPDLKKSPEKAVKFAGLGMTTSVKPVPGPLITDSTLGPLVDPEPMNGPPSPAAEVSKKKNALEEIKKTRAQKLLEVLSLNL